MTMSSSPHSKRNGVFQATFQGNSCKNQVTQHGFQRAAANFFSAISVHVTSFIEAGACILKRFLKTVEN